MDILLCNFKKINDVTYKNTSGIAIRKLLNIPDIDLDGFIKEIKVYSENGEYTIEKIVSNTYDNLISLHQKLSDTIIAELQANKRTSNDSLLRRVTLLSSFISIVKFKMNHFHNDDDIIIIIR